MEKSIVFLLDNAYLPDNRVQNEINSLNDFGYYVELFCVEDVNLPEQEELDGLKITRNISPFLHKPFSKVYREFTSKFSDDMSKRRIDVLHCHDFRMFLLGCEIKKKNPEIKLIYDSHEYLLGYPYFSRVDKTINKVKGFVVWLWYVFKESISLHKSDVIITVSESLRQLLSKRSGVPSFLVRNIPHDILKCEDGSMYWHKKFNLPEEIKVLIHTGNAHFSKKRLILLLNAVKEQKNLALVFLGTNKSVSAIMAEVESSNYERVYFHEQIPRKYITYYCSQANFGLIYTWNKTWISYWYALPNKLMDVSCAGIPVIGANQPEISRFINEFKHGITFDGEHFESINKALSELIDREEELKKNASVISDKVNWEKEKTILESVYRQLLED